MLSAIDSLFELLNPFDYTQFPTPVKEDTVLGVTVQDPVSWLSGMLATFGEDIVALVLRGAFLVIGGLLVWRVLDSTLHISEQIQAAQQQQLQIVEKVLPLLIGGV